MPTLRNGIWEFESVADAAEFVRLAGDRWTVQLVPREPRHGAFIRSLPDQQARLMRCLAKSDQPLSGHQIRCLTGLRTWAIPALFRALRRSAEKAGIRIGREKIRTDGYRVPITHYYSE